jgi:large repetitive protein
MRRSLTTSSLLLAISLVAACGGSQVSPPAAPATVGASGAPKATAPASTETPIATPTASPAPSASAAPPSGSQPPTSGPRWEDAGQMTIPRLVTHAILLADGRVLVAGNDGGSAVGDPRDDTALVDLGIPADGRWTAGSALNKPRGVFAAIALADGRVLVTGGLNQGTAGCLDRGDNPQSFSSTYLYDPGRDAWERAGLLSTARSDPAIALLPDGRVLVAGGYYPVRPSYGWTDPDAPARAELAVATGSTNRPRPTAQPMEDVEPDTMAYALATAEVFDPATGEWTKTGPLRYARYGVNAVTLTDGRVLIAGSGPGSSDGVAQLGAGAATTAEIYDPRTGRFTMAGRFPGIDLATMRLSGKPSWVKLADPQPYDNGTLVALPGGDALLVGNTWWWKHEGNFGRTLRYDASENAWAMTGRPWVDVWSHESSATWSTGTNRIGAAVAALANDQVLIAGGGGGAEGSVGITRSVQLYDPAKDQWTKLPNMPTGRSGGTALLLADDSALIVGGYGNDENRWTECDRAGGMDTAIRYVPGR